MRRLLSLTPPIMAFVPARCFPFRVAANPGSGPSTGTSPYEEPACRFGLIRFPLLTPRSSRSGHASRTIN